MGNYMRQKLSPRTPSRPPRQKVLGDPKAKALYIIVFANVFLKKSPREIRFVVDKYIFTQGSAISLASFSPFVFVFVFCGSGGKVSGTTIA